MVEEIDAELSPLLRGWTLDRVAPLEKSIMRVAIYEMKTPRRHPAKKSRSTRP